MQELQFATKRTELLQLYSKNNVPFIATTRGVHSCRSLMFRAVDLQATGIASYLVAEAGQILSFFNYGIGDMIQLSGNAAHRATEADTMLTKGSRTTASNDIVIEWIAMAPRAIKCQYLAANIGQFDAAATPNVSVVRALTGGDAAVVDPFGRIVPVDVGASATLQHVLYQAVAPFMSCRFEWDNADRTEKMGTCDQFTQGGGASYLNANGEPSVGNRFRIPEGFLWARESQPASELIVNVRLENDVVIPFGQVVSPIDGTWPPLQAMYVEIQMRLGGLACRVPGSN
jgi:hypothetical protein